MKADDISAGVTAFIDLLGFGDKVANAQSFEDIQDIHRSVQLIRKELEFEPEDESVRDVQEMYKATVIAFSDCVIVNIPLESKATKYEGTFDPIMSQITKLAYAQGECCLHGYFLRGGIDLGWWHHDGSTVISRSMVNAYRAERDASVPVIALTPDVYGYFADHAHRNFYSKDFDPIPSVFRPLEVENGGMDGECFYLDYMTICLESLGWQHSREQVERYRASNPDDKNRIMNEGYQYNSEKWLRLHAQRILSAYNSTQDEHVQKKYRWLCAYHNQVVDRFTSEEDCYCRVDE